MRPTRQPYWLKTIAYIQGLHRIATSHASVDEIIAATLAGHPTRLNVMTL
jgi:hypothetical protein